MNFRFSKASLRITVLIAVFALVCVIYFIRMFNIVANADVMFYKADTT